MDQLNVSRKGASEFSYPRLRAWLSGILLPLAAWILTSCTATEVSNPPRTAFEQLLLSTATDNALAGVELPEVRGETVYVERRYLESYDEPYVLGSIRALLSRNGALLQEEREMADIIVEPRSGTLGTDESGSILGLPSVPIVLPAVGTFETPQVALYASEKEDTVAKIALLAYRRDGSHLFSREDLVGKSYLHQYKVLLMFNINFTNVPERDDY